MKQEPKQREMTLNEYQQKAKQTAIYPKEQALEYLTLGLVGEAGEIANKVKKVIRDDDGGLSSKKREELIGELGDVLWYLANLATELDTYMHVVGELNIGKLTDRKMRGALKGSGDKR